MTRSTVARFHDGPMALRVMDGLARHLPGALLRGERTRLCIGREVLCLLPSEYHETYDIVRET